MNEQLQENDRAKISAGLVFKAMILNGLGFIHSPLYLFSQFFEDKPLEHLLGKGVKASYLKSRCRAKGRQMRGDFGGRETNISKPPAEWLRTMKALCRFLRWSPPERIVFDYRLSDEFFNRHKGRSTEFGDRPNPNVKF
ncbi:MAG: DUF4277 domain-containing protein [Woronichinia naegeliana WA131]|uniref:DUF4277 domain-containing protein n=1 Tax=Woronichinia naegeliana WA131 TaxID=2824559 RepID=A0A977PZ65_9CYAN|nr:MAG: DUF4277 domain-containing protein [Woronichinia naegeliana WA131]